MVMLVRGSKQLKVGRLFWEACQIYARQSGCRPAGAIGTDDRQRHSLYVQGCVVTKQDAHELATALEKFINGEKADRDVDLAAMTAVVNFTRGGAFVIR
jgi:hypothetical protein